MQTTTWHLKERNSVVNCAKKSFLKLMNIKLQIKEKRENRYENALNDH